MSIGVLFVAHQRARGEEAEDEAGVQTGDAVDKSSVDQVVSLQVHLVMLPWKNGARADLLFIFNFLPCLLSIVFKEKINVPFCFLHLKLFYCSGN